MLIRKKKEKKIVIRTATFFLGANVSMFVFVIGIFMQLINLNYKLNWELIQMGLVFLGQIISDLCIVFSFNFKDSSNKKMQKTSKESNKKTQEEVELE